VRHGKAVMEEMEEMEEIALSRRCDDRRRVLWCPYNMDVAI